MTAFIYFSDTIGLCVDIGTEDYFKDLMMKKINYYEKRIHSFSAYGFQ